MPSTVDTSEDLSLSERLGSIAISQVGTSPQQAPSSLPVDLIYLILSFIDDVPTLCSFAQTCSLFSLWAKRFIYHSVFVGPGTSYDDLTDWLEADPRNATVIKELEIRCESDEEAWGARSVVQSAMRRMMALESIIIESPYCNLGLWHGSGARWEAEMAEYMSVFHQASLLIPSVDDRTLRCLRSLTIHSNGAGNESYPAFEIQCVFLHPTLQELTISCCYIDKHLPLLQGHERSTSLESLTLEECHMAVPGLASILAVPRELKRLQLGEGRHNTELFMTEWKPSIIDTIAKQPSLTHFTHISLYQPYMNPISPATQVKEMMNLKTVEFSQQSLFRDYLTKGLAPPEIEHVRILDISLYWLRSNTFVVEAAEFLNAIPKLLQVDIVVRVDSSHLTLNAGDMPLPFGFFLLSQGYVRDHIYDLGRIFRKRKPQATVKVFAKTQDYVPPFLYGEPIPQEVLLYDSSIPTVFGGVDYSRRDTSRYKTWESDSEWESASDSESD